jgi:IS5 family transposase
MHMNGEQTNFLMPIGMSLNPNNRWVRLAKLVPWHIAEPIYRAQFDRTKGGPELLPVRVALGALIIKERLCLTDRETVEQIRENPYLQYFIGKASFSDVPPFDHSMMAFFRRRLGKDCISAVNTALVEE